MVGAHANSGDEQASKQALGEVDSERDRAKNGVNAIAPGKKGDPDFYGNLFKSARIACW